MKIKLIGSSTCDPIMVRDWIREELGFPSFELPTDGGVTPAGLLIMYAAKRCYNAFGLEQNPNLTQIRAKLAPHIANIVSSGHGSVFEHVSFTFAIEGISRVLSAELNRHRAGVAISEGSGRYIRYKGSIPYYTPGIFQDSNGDSDLMRWKKAKSRRVMRKAFEDAHTHYSQLEKIWEKELVTDFASKKKLTSAFRRIIGIGALTGGTWTFNIRALRHILTLRSSEHAEEEIAELAGLLFDAVKEHEPLLFSDLIKDANGVITTEYNKI